MLNPPVFTLTSPATGVVVGGATVQLLGTLTAVVGRGVVSATIDVGDGVARPVTLSAASWQATVPLPTGFEGTRVFSLSALDATQVTTTATFSVTVDTLAPRLALTSPATGVVVGSTVTLSGTAVDPTGPISMVTITGGVAAQSAPVSVTGVWQAQVTFPTNLDRVSRTVTLQASDALGNVRQQPVQVLVDTSSPVVVISAPDAGALVSASVTFRGTVTDSSPPVSLSADQGSGPAPVSVAGNGQWSTAVSFPSNLDRVTRSITFRATDSVNNQTTVAAQVVVDTQGPVVSFSSPLANALLNQPRTATLSGSAADGSGVSAVSVNCGDGAGARSATLSGSTWTVAWPLPTADGAGFVCTATATDTLGNTSTSTRSFLVDTVAPVVSFLAPAAGAALGGPTQSSVTARVTVTDGFAATPTVTLSFNSTQVPATRVGTTNEWTATFTLPTVDRQSFSLSAEAVDTAVNTGSATRAVFVDKVAPRVAFTAPAADARLNAAAFPSGSNAVQVLWTVTDADVTAGTLSVNGAGVSLTTTSFNVVTSASDNGTPYSVTVVAVDAVGNPSTGTRSFSVDRVGPTVVSATPANDSRMNLTRRARVTFSELIQGPSSALRLNGVPTTTNLAMSAVETLDLPGSTVFQVSIDPGVTDLYGNPTVPFSWRFHTAPVIPASGTRVTSNVQKFDAAGDQDGQITIAFAPSGSTEIGTFTLNGLNGSFVQNANAFNILQQATYSSVHVQQWGSVASDLSLVRVRAVNGNGTIPDPLNTVLSIAVTPSILSVDSISGGAATAPGGLPVVTPPIESGDGTGAIGFVMGQNYTRVGLTAQSMAFAPSKIISSPRRWVGFALSGNTLLASHRGCGNNPFSGMRTCGFDEGSVAAPVASTALQTLSGAVSPSGCLVYAFDGLSGRLARVLNLGSNFAASTGGSYSTLAAPGPGFSVAPRPEGGLYGAWVNGQGLIQVSYTTSPTTCTAAALLTNFGSNWTGVGTVNASGSTNFRVVQLGTRPAVVYLDGTDLFLAYP